jgi:hypothetical protein
LIRRNTGRSRNWSRPCPCVWLSWSGFSEQNSNPLNLILQSRDSFRKLSVPVKNPPGIHAQNFGKSCDLPKRRRACLVVHDRLEPDTDGQRQVLTAPAFGFSGFADA